MTVLIPAFDADVRAPGWSVGTGGWDTHAHVFGPESDWPYAADRAYTPPDATPADYLRTLDALGLSHGVLVQPSCYGTDNSRLLAALAIHPDRFVGVVDMPLEDLRPLPGVRGLRLRWPALQDRIHEIVPVLRALGWHADVLVDRTDSLPALFEAITDLPVVVEAMGSPHAGEAVASRGFGALREWLAAGEGWVKLSHPYAIDGHGPGPYPHSERFARALVEAAPDRCVWGSDWPHPMKVGPVPNDGTLLDLLPRWVGGAETARAVLATNPLSLYGRP
ncbi:amidohydrolase family protein [Pseudonocardia pini]|uniref:amidohydrolase family protein n=1 Tax=Pseudonocardia pini TaxID=2758030 RepID=UPI0015EFF2BA|nr:amidohydrolase family protein [Pseudonocardia pini]